MRKGVKENKRLKNENNELKDKLNREAHYYYLDKTNEISEHIRKHLIFDLDQINEIIRYEISQHIKVQTLTDSNEQTEIKNNIKQNISNHNLNNMSSTLIKYNPKAQIKSTIRIPRGTWHRLIEGTGDISVIVEKVRDI